MKTVVDAREEVRRIGSQPPSNSNLKVTRELAKRASQVVSVCIPDDNRADSTTSLFTQHYCRCSPLDRM